MALFIDMYKPKKMEELTFNNKINLIFSKIIDDNNLPNIMLYGPDGSGKKTRVFCLLQKIYGDGIYIKKSTEFKYDATTITIKNSQHHYEIDGQRYGKNSNILRSLINDLSASANVYNNSYKVIIIWHCELLCNVFQSSLRRIMELLHETTRFILVTNRYQKILEPIRSRCVLIRCPSPSNIDIINILKSISKNEHKRPKESVFENIINSKNRNLNKIILLFQSYYSTDKFNITVDEVEYITSQIIELILSPKLTDDWINGIRDKMYDLLINCYNFSDLIVIVMNNILSKEILSPYYRNKFINISSKYEYNTLVGSKPTIHFEAFIFEIINIINENNANNINNINIKSITLNNIK